MEARKPRSGIAKRNSTVNESYLLAVKEPFTLSVNISVPLIPYGSFICVTPREQRLIQNFYMILLLPRICIIRGFTSFYVRPRIYKLLNLYH